MAVKTKQREGKQREKGRGGKCQFFVLFYFSSRGRKIGKWKWDEEGLRSSCARVGEEGKKGRREERETRFEPRNPWIERGEKEEEDESGHTQRGRKTFLFFLYAAPPTRMKRRSPLDRMDG